MCSSDLAALPFAGYYLAIWALAAKIIGTAKPNIVMRILTGCITSRD